MLARSSLGSAAALLVFSGLAGAQDLGRSGRDYLPTAIGATWRYERTEPGREATVVEATCRRAAQGMPASVEVRAYDGRSLEMRFWQADERGVSEHLGYGVPRGGPGGEPEDGWAWSGADAGLRPRAGVDLHWLRFPPGLHTEWSLARPSPEPGLDGIDLGHPPLHYTTRVEGFAEEVTVPAGRFRTIKVAIEVRAGDGSLRQRKELWFARDVGPVKVVWSALNGRDARVLQSDVLSSFRSPPAPLAAARAFVRLHAERWPTEPELVALQAPCLTSLAATRFVLAQAEGDRMLLAVDRDGARLFDPTREADVETLARAELLGLDGSHSLGAQDVFDLARVCLLTRTVQALGKPIGPRTESTSLTSVMGPDGARTMQVSVSRDETTARLTMSGGRVSGLGYRGFDR